MTAPVPKPREKLWNEDRRARAQALLDAGQHDTAVARALGMSSKAIANALFRGLITRPAIYASRGNKTVEKLIDLECRSCGRTFRADSALRIWCRWCHRVKSRQGASIEAV